MFDLPPTREVAMLRFLAVAALAVALPALGQSVQQQGKSITFPDFTADQNWTRAASLMNAQAVGGFAYAKAHGASAEEYGRWSAKTFGPGWGAPNSGSAIRYARSIQNNWRALRDAKFEILNVNDTLVVMRASRAYASFFGAAAKDQATGVTLDEYETIYRVFQEEIGRHLGLRFQWRIDGDWVTMTISGRAPNAVIDFPRSTYRIELTAQDPGVNPALVGSSEVTFAPGGRYTILHDGKPYLTADYDVSLDEIVFKNAPGADCAKPGRYRWTVNPTSGNLTFGRLSDDCGQRSAFFARVAFTKK
jgi:hypothetical protein